MKNETIEQLRNMRRHAIQREKEWMEEFPPNSYQVGYAHGMVMAYSEIFENLSAFENAKMFS